MRESMFIRLLGGVSSDYVDAIPLIPFGRWLLSVGIVLLAVGFYAQRDKKEKMLSLYRYGTVLVWWKKHFAKGVVCGIRTAALLLLLVLTWDLVMGNIFVLSPEMIANISTLWLLHSVSMAALFALLDLFPARRFVPGALLLLEGVTFIIGCRVREISHVMYGMWGMYLQSSFYENGGFPAGVIIAAEVMLSAAGFFMGREYLKRETNFI